MKESLLQSLHDSAICGQGPQPLAINDALNHIYIPFSVLEILERTYRGMGSVKEGGEVRAVKANKHQVCTVGWPKASVKRMGYISSIHT